MFKELLNAWRSKDQMSEMFDMFLDMLDSTRQTYDMANQVLWDDASKEEHLEDEVYTLDIKINKAERAIRKKLVSHLAISSRDIPASLVLMSVSKDAERIGDYCKNLLDVARIKKQPAKDFKFANTLIELRDTIGNIFDGTRTAFETNDDVQSHELIVEMEDIAHRAEALVVRAAEADISTNEGVCTALLARHYKRICRHLENIATSVVMPIHKLDFFDEKWKDKKKPASE